MPFFSFSCSVGVACAQRESFKLNELKKSTHFDKLRKKERSAKHEFCVCACVLASLKLHKSFANFIDDFFLHSNSCIRVSKKLDFLKAVIVSASNFKKTTT